MNTKQLRHMVLAIRLGSLARVAAQQGQSRSAISQSISALEDQFGVTLFERSGNAIVPTEVALALLDDCERLLATEQRIEARCQQYLATDESQIRIARDDALPEQWWRDAVVALKQEFPLISFVLVLATPQELPQQVASGAVDLGFGLGLPAHAELLQRNMGRMRVQRVASGQHPLSQQIRLDEDDLQNSTQITLATALQHEVHTAHRLSNDYIGLSSFEQIRDMVEQQVGWAWLPAPLLTQRLRSGAFRVLPVAPNALWQEYQVCYRQSFTLGLVSERLCQRLSDWLLSFD
ncbi:transcriptional regulator, LysR family [Ferrimonas balearica DSM 9799]|uniref:Transcriptional regulator, LysR family n=1 Tax=Ferrimonas balearica (strain DSM 9799 / CCM 4581 / KCTC 23876 / PAT) TaxID=550540 RepID=E1SVT1_FERBD|nr:LysR family transcriptional regulator [Ferrimonas balearica]ADN76412.1 transcriptional regulator, LysR family [Ferrimonas balearica DSM 9799]